MAWSRGDWPWGWGCVEEEGEDGDKGGEGGEAAGERNKCSATPRNNRNIGVAATERWWYGFILRCAQQSTIANNDRCELGRYLEGGDNTGPGDDGSSGELPSD